MSPVHCFSLAAFCITYLQFWPERPHISKKRPTASRLGPDYLADFLPEQIWRTFYIVVLPDFLTYYFPRFRVQKDILLYLNITNWPILKRTFLGPAKLLLVSNIARKEKTFAFFSFQNVSQKMKPSALKQSLLYILSNLIIRY
jgi:hypothetical protein